MAFWIWGVLPSRIRLRTVSYTHLVSIALKTPVGTVIDTGDFKIDTTPISGEMIDLTRFGELGKKGVLLLMADSTNAERPGFAMSESSVGKALEAQFKGCLLYTSRCV